MTVRIKLPLIVLAGSDRRPGAMPEEGGALHPLSGYKGVDIEIGGRPLIDLLIERLELSGLFGPLFVAGPTAVYGEARGPAHVIDTDSSFGENIAAALAHAVAECRSSADTGASAIAIAITTCDILPEVDELRRLLDEYSANAPLDFWFPLILAPEKVQQLGASSWKPEYLIAPHPGAKPKALLPGHLIIVDPAAIRLPLVYRTFNLAYRSRNQSILYRLWLIVSHVFAGLLFQDLRHILGLRLPTLTVTVVFHGVMLALRLRKGVISNDELADRLHRMFVKYRHRKLHPTRRGRLPLVEALSLAKDIDTVEEAEEIARQLE